MKYSITDSHVHSIFSEDGENTIKELCEKTIKNNVEVLTFTEHVDFNPLDPGYKYLKLEKYLDKVKEVKNKYKGQLKVMSGVEFSEPHIYPEKLAEYNEHNLDLIIGAIHWIGDFFVGDEELLEKYSKDEIFLRYYNLVYDSVKQADFDVLAHLDFPKRYLDYEYKNFHLIPQILRMMVDNNIILEINTSTLRKGFSEPMPSKWILSKYREMGGEKVIIGSDAHRVNEIRANFEEVYEIIEDLELSLGYFENREFVNID